MAGIFTPTSLAAGQLPSTTGTLYTAAVTVIIKSIVLVNTDSATRAVNLFIKKSGGSDRRIIPKDTALAAGYCLEADAVYTLSVGDLIEGDAAAATVVDYSISGVIES